MVAGCQRPGHQYVFRDNSEHLYRALFTKSAYLLVLAFQIWHSGGGHPGKNAARFSFKWSVRRGHECGAWAPKTLLLQCCRRPSPDLPAMPGRQTFDAYKVKLLSSARALAWCPYPQINTRALRFQNITESVDGPWNSEDQGGSTWAQPATQPNAGVGQLRIP